MMIFILNIKQGISNDIIETFFASRFSLKKCEIAPLESEAENVAIRYEYTIRDNFTEFNCQIVAFVDDKLCLQSGIYNSLQLALPFSALINEDVVINDHSIDPTRWILVKSTGEIYVADELLVENDENSFVIDRKTMKRVTIEEAFAVMPSKEYVEMEEGKRPVYYNTSESWNNLLPRP
jgi:hypothetical protein